MRVAVHQPEFFPCLPLLAKIARAERLVLLDDVPFKHDSMQHRARIADRGGRTRWLTIPRDHGDAGRLVREIRVGTRPGRKHWTEEHLDLLGETYRGAPGLGLVVDLYDALTDVEAVAEIAARTMEFLLRGYLPPAHPIRAGSIVSSSTLSVDPTLRKGARVLAICEAVGATTYVSGRGGASYLDAEAFRDAGITIEVSDFVAPHYTRAKAAPLADDEWARISGLDALMHLGVDALPAYRSAPPASSTASPPGAP